jgi:hypothetical protein
MKRGRLRPLTRHTDLDNASLGTGAAERVGSEVWADGKIGGVAADAGCV